MACGIIELQKVDEHMKERLQIHNLVKYCNAYLTARTSLGGMKLARIYRGPVTLGFYENSFNQYM